MPKAKCSTASQRKLDQSQGLIPFAVELNQDLVGETNCAHTLANQRDVELNTLVAELLRKGLAAEYLLNIGLFAK